MCNGGRAAGAMAVVDAKVVQDMGNARSPILHVRTRRLHPWPVRLMHWANAVAVLMMIGSGWRIYDNDPIFSFINFPVPFTLGGEPALTFRLHGDAGFGNALLWHFAFMWLLVANGMAYLTYGVFTGRFRRMLWPISLREGLLSATSPVRSSPQAAWLVGRELPHLPGTGRGRHHGALREFSLCRRLYVIHRHADGATSADDSRDRVCPRSTGRSVRRAAAPADGDQARLQEPQMDHRYRGEPDRGRRLLGRSRLQLVLGPIAGWTRRRPRPACRAWQPVP